jgi:hypothetical protein
MRMSNDIPGWVHIGEPSVRQGWVLAGVIHWWQEKFTHRLHRYTSRSPYSLRYILVKEIGIVVVYGVDFTSTPRAQKPITCAECMVTGSSLKIEQIKQFATLGDFEVFLDTPGPWIGGFDFPFGLSRTLITGLGWDTEWKGYVAHAGTMSRNALGEIFKGYRDSKPQGQKQPKRATDEQADSCSPMMWYGVPVGKMFHEGATRLLRADVDVVPCYRRGDSRVAIEVYPALVARRFTAGAGYKNDMPRKQTLAQRDNRQRILNGIQSPALQESYGISVAIEHAHATLMVAEPMADRLDAVLCAIQAAWAHLQRGVGYGIPKECDLAEGWIVDPGMIETPLPTRPCHPWHPSNP